MDTGPAMEPTNLMRLREKLASAGKTIRDQKEFGTESPQEQLERLNEICLMTKGTPAYTMAQAKALMLMKQLEGPEAP